MYSGRDSSSTGLLISGLSHRFSQVGMRPVEGITKACYWRAKPTLNELFRSPSLKVGLLCSLQVGRVVTDTVAANFVSITEQLLKHPNVIRPPINLAPIVNMR